MKYLVLVLIVGFVFLAPVVYAGDLDNPEQGVVDYNAIQQYLASIRGSYSQAWANTMIRQLQSLYQAGQLSPAEYAAAVRQVQNGVRRFTARSGN